MSRYLDRAKGKRSNHIIGDQRFEVFAALDLPSASFSAADLVGLYYGRSAQENHFAKLEAEFGFKAVYSYHPAGQRFAVLCSAVWNTMIAAAKPATDPAICPTPRACPPLPLPDDLVLPPASVEADPTGDIVADALRGLDWPGLLRRRPNWRWNADTLEVTHAKGHQMKMVNLHRSELRFGATAGTTQATFQLTPADAHRLRQALQGRKPGEPIPAHHWVTPPAPPGSSKTSNHHRPIRPKAAPKAHLGPAESTISGAGAAGCRPAYSV